MLSRVELRNGEDRRIAIEFPTLAVDLVSDVVPHVGVDEWRCADFDTWRFDAAMESETSLRVDATIAIEVLTRCQRLIGRRNAASRTLLFDVVLARHRELHDLTKPLVRADYNHALDVWQWLLRLAPHASLAVQLAALFHDVERLTSEAERRVEHLAPDYQRFKDAHARAGAAIAQRILLGSGVPETIAGRVAQLITDHERGSSDDEEVALLNDADGLSFFSLNSSGYARYFGPEQTKKKVAYTLARMRPAAKAKLATVRIGENVLAAVE